MTIRAAMQTIGTVVVYALMALGGLLMVSALGTGGAGWISVLTDFGWTLVGMLAVIAVGAMCAGIWDGIKRL